MSPVWRSAKSFLFWSYGRTTWQYDVLCALILAFVFLTPKTWFDAGEPARQLTHQKGLAAAQKLLIWPDVQGPNPDAQEIERRARIATGRPAARVKTVREIRDEGGRTIAYEVDIE
jgi:hypothetical protein